MSDLTDPERELIAHLVPKAKPGGRPERYPQREVLNGIVSVVCSGRAWRLLPHDLPPFELVYHDFREGRLDSTWQLKHDVLCGEVRAAAGKYRQPRARMIDSQAVTTTEKGAPRVRCAQTGQRAQAPYPRRSVEISPCRRRDGRQCPRPRWDQASAGGPPV